MNSWVSRERSTARGLLLWVLLSAATLAVVFTSGTLPDWIGVAPFLNTAVAYLVYRNVNPIAAVQGMVSGSVQELTSEQSTGRGWIYGIATAVVGVQVLTFTMGAESLDANQWVVWPVLAVAWLVGAAGAKQRNPLKVLGTGMALLAKLTVLLLLVCIGLGVMLLGYTAVSGFFASYGMLGVIAILLLVIIFKLDQLIRKPAR